MKVIALIPAHNEQISIEAAVESVQDQVDRVIVVADNCTDATVALASATGAEVLETEGNADKKAGALNQALDRLLPELDDDDFVFVMDADGTIDAGFMDAARAKFDSDPELGGVSGTFRGGPGGRFVGTMQRNEYARYARDVRRLKGRALVLTGTATAFRVSTLRDVLRGRHDGRLPHGGGKVYDTNVLTEDNELTLALLHLGWKILAPRDCTLDDRSNGNLGRAGVSSGPRWKRGAFENLRDYGFTRITASYWGRRCRWCRLWPRWPTFVFGAPDARARHLHAPAVLARSDRGVCARARRDGPYARLEAAAARVATCDRDGLRPVPTSSPGPRLRRGCPRAQSSVVIPPYTHKRREMNPCIPRAICP